jgi:Predicted unsaturated glucuronyl hydrolase involved in regulation of bacterial surface properties, and related proteins
MKNADKDIYLYKLMTSEIEEKLRRTAHKYIKSYPHVSKGYEYVAEENKLWTSSFYPGMMFLMYDFTGDEFFLKYSKDYLDSFEDRLDKMAHINHDLGFLFTLTSVSNYKLTGNERAKNLAMRAADMLAARYNEKGNYIQAWGEFGEGTPYVRIIIDTMLNLSLLYWSGNEKYIEIATKHAITSSNTLMRDDYSSFHTYWFNPENGNHVRGATHQGLRDESTWARGQGWAVYGYALSYMYTKEEKFLEVSKNAAEVFIKNLPTDNVPYWDFNFNDTCPDIRDTSAAAIFICGLLELCKWVDEDTAKRYNQVVYNIVNALFENYFEHNPDNCGILRESMYHRDDGANEFTSWGDYFFLEALVRLQKDWTLFW